MEIMKFSTLENKLLHIDDTFVLLDKDVAELYGIEPKRLKEQLKRNIEKFPKDYSYQVSDEIFNIIVSQKATPSKKYYEGTNPWVFTEFEFNLGFAKVTRSINKIRK